jgi:hypothetical protein
MGEVDQERAADNKEEEEDYATFKNEFSSLLAPGSMARAMRQPRERQAGKHFGIPGPPSLHW